jgi:hypothetical protein
MIARASSLAVDRVERERESARMRPSWLVGAALMMPHAARADEPPRSEDGGADYFPAPTGKDIVLEIPGERSPKTLAVVGGLVGGALIAGGIGLYYNLDSRSAADAVSAHEPNGRVWTVADQADVTRAHDSGTRAAIGYGIGGALLIGAAVTYILTEPRSEKRIIHPHGTGATAPTPVPSVVPASGGAVLGGQWSF